MEQITEIWLPVAGYEGFYEVSNFGRVRSFDRWCKIGTRNILKKGKMMKPAIAHGYQRLMLAKDAKRQMVFVHRIVAIAFIKEVKNKPLVNHIDGCKANNVVSNLEWCTSCENMQHAVKMGLIGFANRDRVRAVSMDDFGKMVGKTREQIKRLFKHHPTLKVQKPGEKEVKVSITAWNKILAAA